jgi:hypothetical protein
MSASFCCRRKRDALVTLTTTGSIFDLARELPAGRIDISAPGRTNHRREPPAD